MRAVTDKVIDAHEEVALLGLTAIKSYLVYLGNDPELFKRAKVGAAAIGAYTRLRATEANRMAIDVMVQRAVQKQLEAGDDAAD